MYDKAIFALFLSFSFYLNLGAIRVCDTFDDYDVENSPNCRDNPDAELNVTEIIKRWNFTVEEHYLETEDGYKILIVRAYKNVTKTTPIILAHGIYMNSLAYSDRGEKSLTYILGNNGYDIWLVNFRGTRYSRGHKTLTPQDDDYWYFSFHEMAIYDLKPTVSLVNEMTNKTAICIGFSMGTTISYIYSSLYPTEAKNKLKGIISLAPIAYLTNVPSIVGPLAPFWAAAKPVVYLTTHGEVLPRSNDTGLECSSTKEEIYLCQNLLSLVFGKDEDQMDPQTLPVTSIQNPDSIGAEVITHYSQILLSRKFQYYDYGIFENKLKYGSLFPPKYNLSNILIPVAMFVGENDYLATPKNTQKAYSELNKDNQCGYEIISYSKWNHGDFLNAKNITTYLYPSLLDKISHIETGSC